MISAFNWLPRHHYRYNSDRGVFHTNYIHDRTLSKIINHLLNNLSAVSMFSGAFLIPYCTMLLLSSSVLHGIGTQTVSEMWMLHSMETNLPHV